MRLCGGAGSVWGGTEEWSPSATSVACARLSAVTEQPTSHEPLANEPEDRRLATVRGLLAKAEATEFPEEAEAFFAKASELIARYAIDEALLWASADDAGRAAPDELRFRVEPPYVSQKSLLVSAVAHAHGCRAVRLMTSRSGQKSEELSIIGFPSDLRWVEALVTSLLVQMTAAMLHEQPSGMAASRSAAWRRSFIIGFTDAVAERLETDRASATAASASEASTALVLLDRESLVQQDFSRRHPRIRTTWVSSGSSVEGRSAGRAAGEEASLARDAVGGRRGLPGG